MPDSTAEIVARFDATLAEFRALVARIEPARWRTPGVNTPGPRLFPEDEDRPVNVIAHHVAVWLPRHTELMRKRAAGEQVAIDANALNAQDAVEHAGVTPEDVLAELDRNAPPTREFLSGLTEQHLEMTWETRMGPMSLRGGIERVLIGHVDMHRASIEAALGQVNRDV